MQASKRRALRNVLNALAELRSYGGYGNDGDYTIRQIGPRDDDRTYRERNIDNPSPDKLAESDALSERNTRRYGWRGRKAPPKGPEGAPVIIDRQPVRVVFNEYDDDGTPWAGEAYTWSDDSTDDAPSYRLEDGQWFTERGLKLRDSQIRPAPTKPRNDLAGLSNNRRLFPRGR